MCETGLVRTELSYMIRHTPRFAAEHWVHTPLAQFASRSYKKPSPYGNVLIMSPWNYPFLLTIDPLADAIAAGNTAIVKPSAYAPATGKLVEKILTECFSPEYVAVVMGGREENRALLDQKFDMIFFTGSQNVGKEVLRHAAEHLTPAVLELGGKSPCIVDSTAKIKLAAKRIVFGKLLNCGQTCVAPDYVLCDARIKDALVREIIAEIEANNQVALRYCNADGSIATEFPANPNGSTNSIAGICDKTGRVFGLMPHPEAFLSPFNSPDWTRDRANGKIAEEGDGVAIFRNAADYIAENF